VEQVFRDIESVLETRPVFHQRDENIRGHVFCGFLVLVLRKEQDRRLEEAGHTFEWADIKQDLKSLQQTVTEQSVVPRPLFAISMYLILQELFFSTVKDQLKESKPYGY